MKKNTVILLIGIVVGFLISLLFDSFNILGRPKSFDSAMAPVPKKNGDSSIALYKELWDIRKPFGKIDSTNKYITGFFLDSAGIRKIVNDSNFYGLYIDLGLRKPHKKKTIELLFSGIEVEKDPNGTVLRDPKTNAPITKRFFYKTGNVANRTEGDNYYLDKINPCPGSPGCPPPPPEQLNIPK